MTDKELKRLSRLELLELLLQETRENEKLRAELAKAKKENGIEKSAVILNETAKQLNEALQRVASLGNAPSDTVGSKTSSGKKTKLLGAFSKSIFKSDSKSGKKSKFQRKPKI